MNTGRSMALYRKLVGQIDAYEARLLARYGRYISCRSGCDSCCILESVFPVEAYAVYEAVISGEAEPLRAPEPADGKCAFLSGGICSIYGTRPVICRTHGYPLFIDGRTDFCPENFRELDSLESEYILDLENLNRALVSVNAAFLWESCDPFFKKERINLKELKDFIINKTG